ncbi:MAG: hypothetical protein QM734_15500 [Cyclobacteriaceae bacterium]
MRQILTLIILSTIFIACGPKTSINYKDAIGLYGMGPDSTNYRSELRLRADSTYSFSQDPLSKDTIFSFTDNEFMGKWKVTGDTIVLFKGNDFTNKLTINRTIDSKSDSLLINISGLIKVFGPALGFSINETDLEVVNGKIKIYKRDHWGDSEFNGDYGYVLLPLDIRYQNGFARIDSVFLDKEITLSVDNLSSINLRLDTILCRYSRRDSVLLSANEHRRIAKHDLLKWY